MNVIWIAPPMYIVIVDKIHRSCEHGECLHVICDYVVSRFQTCICIYTWHSTSFEPSIGYATYIAVHTEMFGGSRD